MIYPNLKAELARRGWTISFLASLIKSSTSNLYAKLSGKVALKVTDAFKIKTALGDGNLTLDYLFARGEKA